MRSDYLRFGGVPEAEALETSAALEFLRSAGFGHGPLTQARTGRHDPHQSAAEFEAIGGNYCDFCLVRLMGGEYDVLEDGRERCVTCSRSAVKTQSEFIELFKTTRQTMEMAFSTSIRVPLEIRMADAKEIAARTGEIFEPSPGVSARVLGFAVSSNHGYTICVENGAPALAAVTTIVHELTHIWQYLNWENGMVETRYGSEHQLEVAEGMATWAQVQYLLSIKEFDHAERQERYAAGRSDAYGVGFRLFCERYPLRKNGVLGRETPFTGSYPL